MNSRQVARFNEAKRPDAVVLNCLALPSAKTPEVEIVYEEGTCGTDLDNSVTFAGIMDFLGLNEDIFDSGCNQFYLTVSLDKPTIPAEPQREKPPLVPLTPNELRILSELRHIAGSDRLVTGKMLRDHNFADFVASIFGADVSYPQSLQSRKLQVLRDKGYITMHRYGGGTYKVLDRPVIAVSFQN